MIRVEKRGIGISFMQRNNSMTPYTHTTIYNREYDCIGETLCILTELVSRDVLGIGKATCSASDRFVAETGRKLALTRALAYAELPRPVRADIWEAYRARR